MEILYIVFCLLISQHVYKIIRQITLENIIWSVQKFLNSLDQELEGFLFCFVLCPTVTKSMNFLIDQIFIVVKLKKLTENNSCIASFIGQISIQHIL